MSIILPFGTAICKECREPVAIVRQTVEQPCDACLCCNTPHGYLLKPDHTHAIPDVAWTVVDAEGERHLCAK